MPPTSTESVPSPTPTRTWVGPVVLGLMMALLLATWLPTFNLALGDSHDGRILSRFALHVDDFWELGPIGSRLGGSWTPFETDFYGHHPPLSIWVQVALSGFLGQGVWQLRLWGFFSGLLAVGSTAVLLRRRGLGWWPSLLAVGTMITVPYFWIYGRLSGGFGILLLMSVLVNELASGRENKWVRRAVIPVTVGAVWLSWPSGAGAGLLWIWYARRRGLGDRGVRAVAVTGILAAAAIGGWMLWTSGAGDLYWQTRFRIGELSWADFAERQWVFLLRLAPAWYRLLIVPAIIAGFADRRTRPFMVTLGLPAVAWTVGLKQGAFQHDYWNLNWVPMITIGAGALVEYLRPVGENVRKVAAGLVVVGLAGWLVALATGPTADIYFREPAAAGVLMERNQPPAGTKFAYVMTGMATPRWASVYWDMRAYQVNSHNFSNLDPETLVVVRLDFLPCWLESSVVAETVAAEGRYGLIEAGKLADHLNTVELERARGQENDPICASPGVFQ